jgi:NAD-dependent deacetylase
MKKRIKMSKIIVLTGAGVSAESGIRTFRDAGGLWEGYKIEEVATPEGWRKNPEQVLDFYNERRRQLLEVKPNPAHFAIASLDRQYDVKVITQNVDDLHERGGSKHIIHLHGELLKSRSSVYEHLIYECRKDIRLGDVCEKGFQLRPHIVWFGEMVPMLEPAIQEMLEADIVLVIGSSMQVYPAASLVAYAPPEAAIYYIDPNPKINYELGRRSGLQVIAKNAAIGVPELVTKLNSGS